MKWENLTADQLHDAVIQCKKTVVIPTSIIEKHGHHLPLGTDAMINRVILAKAEETVDFVIAPEVVYCQGSETMNGQGTIAIRGDVTLELLENICDEMYRNGFEKIIIADGHGGNNHLIPYFAQCMLTKGKPYLVYCVNTWYITDEEEKELGDKYGWDDDPGHADRDETALVMAYDESLVHMDRYDEKEPHYFPGLEWMGENRIYAPANWAISRKNHVTGRPDLGCRELGEKLCAVHARHLARQIALIRDDENALSGYRQFLAQRHFEEK